LLKPSDGEACLWLLHLSSCLPYQEQVVEDGDGTAEADPFSRRCTDVESPEVGTATTGSGCGALLRLIDPRMN
jgi:hypothetical protein